MASMPLYTVNKIPLMDIVNENYYMVLDNPEGCHYNISQQENPLFRQIRLIAKNDDDYNPHVLFVDCKGQKNKISELSEIVVNGFYFNGKRFVLSERSASMSRNSILSFVDHSISDKLNERITMGISFEKTVLSKYLAYRGLMFSSCFTLENWFPKVIVVEDYETVIPNQHIKFLKDEVVDFVDKTGQQRTWKQKAITDGERDLDLNAFDGCGLHHPQITKEVKALIQMKGVPTSILWRLPMVKGVTHQFDYTNYLVERGVEVIVDIWGMEHSVYEPMMIITKSMYKGFPYFKQTGTIEDWNRYWVNFHKYNHCFGVAKWNFSPEEEPVFTGANYQILQDLDLPFEDFLHLATPSMDYIERVIQGVPEYTYHFLGLTADKHDGLNNYMRAVLKNPEMMRETGVKKYVTGLLRKKMDDMKCGKIYLDATFKFLAPDLIALVEHIGKLPIVGILDSDEFWTQSKYKYYEGEYLIERNPHICSAEHVILRQSNREELWNWCGHLQNVCMINIRGITTARLNGADWRFKNKSCLAVM
jgi:hypothetical protein